MVKPAIAVENSTVVAGLSLALFSIVSSTFFLTLSVSRHMTNRKTADLRRKGFLKHNGFIYNLQKRTLSQKREQKSAFASVCGEKTDFIDVKWLKSRAKKNKMEINGRKITKTAKKNYIIIENRIAYFLVFRLFFQLARTFSVCFYVYVRFAVSREQLPRRFLLICRKKSVSGR